MSEKQKPVESLSFEEAMEEIEQIAKHFNVAASKLLSPIFMSESREAALADGGEE